MVQQGFLTEGLQKTSAGLGSVRLCTMHPLLLCRILPAISCILSLKLLLLNTNQKEKDVTVIG